MARGEVARHVSRAGCRGMRAGPWVPGAGGRGRGCGAVGAGAVGEGAGLWGACIVECRALEAALPALEQRLLEDLDGVARARVHVHAHLHLRHARKATAGQRGSGAAGHVEMWAGAAALTPSHACHSGGGVRGGWVRARVGWGEHLRVGACAQLHADLVLLDVLLRLLLARARGHLPGERLRDLSTLRGGRGRAGGTARGHPQPWPGRGQPSRGVAYHGS